MTSGPSREILRMQMVSKAVLSPEEKELYELSQLAGVTMDPEIFKILLDLLKMNVPPVAIIQTLKSMCTHQRSSTHQHHHVELSPFPHHSMASGEPTPAGIPRERSSTADNLSLQRAGSGDRKFGDQVAYRRSEGQKQNRPLSSDLDSYSSVYNGDRSYPVSSGSQAVGSRSQSRLVSDVTYGGGGGNGYEPRIRDRERRGPNLSEDNFVTPRQRDTYVSTRARIGSDFTGANYDSDKGKKKRSSYHN